MNKKILSKWIVVDDFCATRVLEGTDPSDEKNRIAFIEKTPRVQVYPEEWLTGPKGTGGAWNEDHQDLGQYGFDQESRDWCDSQLIELGYELN